MKENENKNAENDIDNAYRQSGAVRAFYNINSSWRVHSNPGTGGAIYAAISFYLSGRNFAGQ